MPALTCLEEHRQYDNVSELPSPRPELICT